MKSLPKNFADKFSLKLFKPIIKKQELLIFSAISIFFLFLAGMFWNLTREEKLGFWNKHSQFDLVWLEKIHNSVFPVIGFLLEKTYLLTGAEVTAFLVAGTLGFFLWKRWWKEAIILGFFALSILLMNDLVFKPFFFRLRPPGWLIQVTGRSFPSGHATGNVFFYFYTAYVLSYQYPKWVKYLYGIATCLVLMIGWSSIYVRVHWLTDILAGYGLGYLWLLLALVILRASEPKYRQFEKTSNRQ